MFERKVEDLSKECFKVFSLYVFAALTDKGKLLPTGHEYCRSDKNTDEMSPSCRLSLHRQCPGELVTSDTENHLSLYESRQTESYIIEANTVV